VTDCNLLKAVCGILYLIFFFTVFLEPVQNSVKYLTWQRTMSSRSSSSRNPLGPNSKDEIEDLTNNLFDSLCMISGSHASTLDRLYAWERKLYDEVKVLYTVYFSAPFRLFFILAMLCFIEGCCRSLGLDIRLSNKLYAILERT